MTVTEGADYSYDPPDPAGLVAAGKQFVVRYGAVGKTGKWLTAAEVAALRAAGLAVVANVEESAEAFRGATAGTRHATAGDVFFRNLGMPPDRPIFFSVDWDAGPADWPDVDAALRAAAAVLGAGRVGVYGSYAVVEHCAQAGTAAWFWQTYAWSGGRWHPAAQLQQYHNNVALAGGTVDLTRAVTADFGQWGGTSDMTFAPQSLLDCRKPFKAHTTLPDVSLGIVGDDNHAQRASSYHLGKSANKPDSYSIAESGRDSGGLSEAASAFDIGFFSLTVNGKTHDLRSFSVWLVGQCAAGTPDTRDIREVIYSPDGKTVKRWDRLGKRSTGDDTHLSHTHTSFFRDSENRDRAAVYRRYFDEILGDDMPLTDPDVIKVFGTDGAITNRPWRGDVATNPKVAANTALTGTWDDAHTAAETAKTVLTELRLMRTALLAGLTAADDGAAVIAAVQAEGEKQAARDAALAGALQRAADELGTIKGLLVDADGSPNLTPVLARIDSLTSDILGRVAAAHDAEAAALRAQG